MQVQWTPKICFIETRKNINKLTTRNLGNLNKCITFDGPLHLSSMKNIGHIVKRIIRNASNDIAEHIAEICYENRKVKNMQLHWKVVDNYTPYFLYCSYLKMEIYEKESGTKFEDGEGVKVDRFLTLDENHNDKVTVNLRNNFNLRNDIDFIYDTSSRNSTLKFKNLICLNCEKVTIPEKFIKIKNDWIFKFYNKRMDIKKVDHDASIDSIEKENELKVKVSSNLVENYWNEDMKLPLYFRKMYKIDRFNKKDVILFFTDTKFKKYKESLICIDCYLNIVKYIQANKKHGTNIYDKGIEDGDSDKDVLEDRIKLVKDVLNKRRRVVTKNKLLKKEEEFEKDFIENRPKFFKKKKTSSKKSSPFSNFALIKKNSRAGKRKLTRLKSISGAHISSTKLPDMLSSNFKSDKISISNFASGRRMQPRSKTRVMTRGHSGLINSKNVKNARKNKTFRSRSNANLVKKQRPMTAIAKQTIGPKEEIDNMKKKPVINIENIDEENSQKDSDSLDISGNFIIERKNDQEFKKFEDEVALSVKKKMKVLDKRIKSSKVFKKQYGSDDFLVF